MTASGPRPKALLAAFHYPPQVSGGAARMLLLEDYLARRGWQVTIATPQAGPAQRGGTVLSIDLPAGLARRTGPMGLLRRVGRRLGALPDVFAPWAEAAAKAVLTGAPPALVVTSSPPESVHAIGRALKRRFGCRWLADLRDGWTFEPHRPEAGWPLRRAFERRLEAAVLAEADWITAATRPIVADLRHRFPAADVEWLPTGFERFLPSAAPPHDHFRLVYTGRFGLSQQVRSPAAFFEGLRRAAGQDPRLADKLRVELVGDYSPRERACWQDLTHLVVQRPPVPPNEAERVAAAATMLLLVTPPGLRSIATRKVFDYLAVRRPVFALAEGNEAAAILAETHAGRCVTPDDPQAIARGLLDVFGLWTRGELDRSIPCSGNAIYLAADHFERVLGPRLATTT